MEYPYVVVALFDFLDIKDARILYNDIGRERASISGHLVSVDHLLEYEYETIIDRLDDMGIAYMLKQCVWRYSEHEWSMV